MSKFCQLNISLFCVFDDTKTGPKEVDKFFSIVLIKLQQQQQHQQKLIIKIRYKKKTCLFQR